MFINRIAKIGIAVYCLFFLQKIKAQDWMPESNPENKSYIGIAGGVMNYSGYMNHAAFTFKHASLSGELMYRYNFTDRFHVRAVGMLGWLQQCNCNVAKNPTNYGSFQTGIAEFDVLPEYDFMNMSTDKWHYRHKWTPYIYAGPGFYRLFHYKAEGFKDGDQVDEFSFNLRWGIGAKYAITPGIQLFFDGSRREFSKHIDFYDSNYQRRYYSLMFGAIVSLQKRHYKHYW